MRTYIVCKRAKYRVVFNCDNCGKNIPQSALTSTKVCPGCTKKFRNVIKIKRGYDNDIDGEI